MVDNERGAVNSDASEVKRNAAIYMAVRISVLHPYFKDPVEAVQRIIEQPLEPWIAVEEAPAPGTCALVIPFERGLAETDAIMVGQGIATGIAKTMPMTKFGPVDVLLEEGLCVEPVATIACALLDPKAMANGEAAPFIGGVVPEAKLEGLITEGRSARQDFEGSRKAGPFPQDIVKERRVSLTSQVDILIRYLLKNGAQFFYYAMNNVTAFLIGGDQCIVLPPNRAYKRWFAENIRWWSAESERAKELSSQLDIRIQSHPKCVQSSSVSWGSLDRSGTTMYLALDPRGSSITRVRASANGSPMVDVVRNGFDGVVLTSMQARERPFRYQPGPMTTKLAEYQRLIHGAQALDELDKLASTAFNVVALLPNLGQRPIKHHRGPQHHGKSAAAKDLVSVLYGDGIITGFKHAEAFWTALDRNGPIIVHDNAETKIQKAFENDYLLAATGGQQSFKKLYVNSEMVPYRPNGTLVLTAIESWTKPELIDRVFAFEFDNSAHCDSDREDDETRGAQILAQSDLLLSFLLDFISTAVLPDYEARRKEAYQHIKRERPGHAKQRFNAFLAIMLLMWDSLGQYLWDERRAGRAFRGKEDFFEFLDRQNDAQKKASVEGNDVLFFLDRIAACVIPEIIDVHPHGGRVVIGPCTTAELFAQASKIAKELGRRFPFEHPPQLGARVRAANQSGILAAAGWSRTTVGGARNNTDRYLFTRVDRIVQEVAGDVIQLPLPQVTPPQGVKAAGEDSETPDSGTS